MKDTGKGANELVRFALASLKGATEYLLGRVRWPLKDASSRACRPTGDNALHAIEGGSGNSRQKGARNVDFAREICARGAGDRHRRRGNQKVLRRGKGFDLDCRRCSV